MTRFLLCLGAIFISLIALARRLLLQPFPLRTPIKPYPARSYRDAVARVEFFRAAEQHPAINPLCHTRLLTHGQSTARVIVMLHGYTNCPQQFSQLADLFFQQGYNVLVPRFPHHGLQDLLSNDHGQLTAGELASVTTEAIDIAHGLGQHITVLGFSMGGTLAAWAAQFRGDIDLAVLVSPAVGLRAVPSSLNGFYGNVFALWPNFFGWFHPELKEGVPRARHAYPRFASRSVAAFLRVSQLVQATARTHPPAAKKILVVTNPTDETVDNWATTTLITQWRTHVTTVWTHEFPARLNLIHDLMDSDQPKQQVDQVYPVLLSLIQEVGSNVKSPTLKA